MPNNRKKLADVALADGFDGEVAQPRDLLADVAHEGGLVALAAIGDGREIGAVGFDQQAVERHAARDLLQLDRVLERDDAREGDVEAEVERALRDVPCLGEAMHDAAHLARALLAHDRERIGRGRAGMDHERLAGLARRADVTPETLALPREVAFEAIVVEPRLADRDDLGRGGLRHQVRDSGLQRVGVVRMDADGRIQVGVRLRDRDHARASRR